MRERLGRLLLCTIMLAAVEWGAATAHGLELDPGTVEFVGAEQGEPGEFVTYVATIRNPSPSEALFGLSVDSPAGWSLLPVAPEIFLDPGSERRIFVSMLIPDREPPGPRVVGVNIERLSDGARQRLEVVTDVPVMRSIAASIASTPHVQRGETARAVVLLENLGNVHERLAFEVAQVDDWRVAIDAAGLELGPGERQSISLEIGAPRSAPSGTALVAELRVLAESGEELAAAPVRVHITPPTPEHVEPLRPDALRANLRYDTGWLTGDAPKPAYLGLSARGRLSGGDRVSLIGLARHSAEQGLWLESFRGSFERAPWSVALRLRGGDEGDPPALSHFRLAYDTPELKAALGDVGRRLSPLVSVGGRGGMVEARRRGVAAGLFLLDRVYGATLASVDPTGVFEDLRITGLIRRDGPDEQSAVSVYGAVRVSEQVRLFSEVVAAQPHGMWLAGAEARKDRLEGRAELYWFGPGAPGTASADSTGFRLSLRRSDPNVPIGVSVHRTQSNVLRTDAAPVQGEQGIQASIGLPFSEGSLALSASWIDEVTLEPVAGFDVVDRSTLRFESAYRRGLGPGYLLIRGRAAQREDRVLSASRARVEVGGEVGWRIGNVTAAVGLAKVGRGETVAQAAAESEWVPRISAEYAAGGQGATRFRALLAGGERWRLRLDLRHALVERLQVETSFESRFQTASAPEYRARLGVVYAFDLPVPGSYGKGVLQGRVVATDANGEVGGLGGLILEVGRTRVSTDDEGFFKFPPLAPGTYQVKIDGDLGMVYEERGQFPVEVEVVAGRVTEIGFEIPIRGRVSGRVGIERGIHLPLAAIRPEGIELQFWRAGELAGRAVTDRFGSFVSPALAPGAYELRIAEDTLPRRTRVISAPDTVVVPPGGIVQAAISLAEEALPLTLDFEASE